MRKPFLPSDLPPVDPLFNWRRRAVAMAVAHSAGETLETAAARLWPSDSGAIDGIQRAATSPATLTGWGSALTGRTVGPYLASLAPQSAAARLFQAAARIEMDGLAGVGLPYSPNRFPDPVFIGEGNAIPVYQGSFGTVPLGPPRKLAAIAALTGELGFMAKESAQDVISLAMDEAAGRALDSAVFSTASGSDIRPAGLLNNVTAITATSGGGLAALTGDLRNLVGGLADAGGGGSVAFIANPRQVLTIKLLAGAGFDYPVIPGPSLAAGTVIALDVAAIASGFAGLPEFTIGTDTALHFEDTAPLQIATPGSPNTVAAPVRSTFQADMIAIRMILRCAWASRKAGAVQYVTGTSW